MANIVNQISPVDVLEDLKSSAIDISNKIESFERSEGADIEKEYAKLIEQVSAFTQSLIKSQSDISVNIHQRCTRAKEKRAVRQLGF